MLRRLTLLPTSALRLVLLTFVALALLYAWIVPPLEGFDALAHFGYAGYLHQERRLPTVDRELVPRSYELVVQPPLYFAAIALATTPLPMAQAQHYAQASDSPYHEKSLSLRQTVTLPMTPWGVTVTLWVTRLVSLLGSLAAVVGTYALVRTLLPDQPWLAVATTSVVGFNPQFLFTAVTVTNDAWTAGISVISLWLLARATLQPGAKPQHWLGIGICAGLAALTKYSCLLLAVPALVLFGPYAYRQGRRAGGALLWIIGGGLISAGFWYWRNFQLYGTPLPLEQMAQVLPTMRRAQPFTLAQTLAFIPWLWNGYWGVFVSILAPPTYFSVTKGLALGGGAGLLLWPWRGDKSSRGREQLALLVALLWVGAIFGGVLHWTRTITFGEQGRLLLAASPALALLLLIGWRSWLPAAWANGLYALTPLFMVGLALWPLPTLQNNYRLPTSITEPLAPDRPVTATFAGGMQLLGFDLPAGAGLVPGERLPLTLYWRAEQEIPANYTLFLHLADEQDQLLYQFDGLPVQGRHPTRQWQPGQVFADRHRLTARSVPTTTLATLSLGFYAYADPTLRQPVFDQNQQPLGDRLILGKVRVLAPVPPTAAVTTTPLARWQGGITLLTAQIQADTTGAPHQIAVQWQATGAIQRDYTVFVQLLDDHNQVLAQLDQLPQAGRAPTSTWRAAEVIPDYYQLNAENANWQQLIIGLYDQTGQRLHLEQPTAAPDYWVLAQR